MEINMQRQYKSEIIPWICWLSPQPTSAESFMFFLVFSCLTDALALHLQIVYFFPIFYDESSFFGSKRVFQFKAKSLCDQS